MENYVQMAFALLLFSSLTHASSLYDPTKYYPGNNLLANPDFTYPTFPTGAGYWYDFAGSIPGWGCQNNCQYVNFAKACQTVNWGCNLTNFTQGIDLDSSCFFDNVSQTVSIVNNGHYLLTLNWVPPVSYPETKQFKLQINQSTQIDIKINASGEQVLTNQSVVSLNPGNWVINLRMYGYNCDNNGAILISVALQQLIAITSPPANNTTPANSSNSTSATKSTAPSNVSNSTAATYNPGTATNNSTTAISNPATATSNSTTPATAISNSSTPATATSNSTTATSNLTKVSPNSTAPSSSTTVPSKTSQNTTNQNLSSNSKNTIPSSSGTNSSTLIVPNSQTYNSSQQEIATFDLFLNTIMFNQVTKVVNELPANRVILNQLTQFLSIFDRLHLYYYHHQNNTFYAQVFISKINQITQSKSSFCKVLFEMCDNLTSICSTVNQKYSQLLSLFDQKYNYTDSDFLAKNSNGKGFFANSLDFIYYQIPFNLLTAFIFFQLFNLLFEYKVSILFRKYSLFAIVLFMFFQGSIQQLTFYLFGELTYFFSCDFLHKLANCVILLVLFVIVVFSVGGLIWLKFHYKRLVKYFIQYYGSNLRAFPFESSQRMVIPLLLGFAHAFYLQHLAFQSALLALVQIFYLFLRILSLRSIQVREKFKVVLSFVASALRIILIITFYLYNGLRQEVINQVHRVIFLAYIGVWFLELLSTVITTFVQFVLISQRLINNQAFYMRRHQHKNKIIKIKKAQKQKQTHKKRNKKKFKVVLVTEENQEIDIFGKKTVKELEAQAQAQTSTKINGTKKALHMNRTKKIQNNKRMLIIQLKWRTQRQIE